MMRLGIQTFTIRKAQKKSFENAYAPLAKMGVDTLEIARIDFSFANAKKLSDLLPRLGITPISVQVKPKHVFRHMDAVVDFCKAVGCKNVVISMLPFSCILGDDEKFYRFVDSLDPFCERYAAHGITLAYHHHNWEYIRLASGKTRMQELLGRTKRIKIVCDTYWVARCGVDPAKQIRELGGRLLGAHLRDLSFRGQLLKVLPLDTSLGSGVIDFRAVLCALDEVGAEYAVIEQNTKAPYEHIANSLKHLEQIKKETLHQE